MAGLTKSEGSVITAKPLQSDLTDGTSDRATTVLADRSVQIRFKAKPDEVVPIPVARLNGRVASRATNLHSVCATEIVLTH
jgi:hypothetical protein